MKSKARRRRNIRLLAKKPEEKAWAALVAVADDNWVSIDAIGDFLVKRQLDATAVRFDPRDPSSRYALPPGVTKYPKGWEPHLVATALSGCVDKKLVEHERRDDGNYFRALKPEQHDLWGLVDDYVPVDPRWSTT